MHTDATNIMLAVLASGSTAFQAGVPCSRPLATCDTSAVTMSVPWRLAGAVGVAGGITTLAVKTIRNKAAESEAAKGRAALLGMNMEGITSGDALDLPRNHAKQEIVGDWKIYTK